MSTKILVKRSSTAGAVPTLAQVSVGELAINTADKRVFTNNGTAIVELGTTPSSQAVAGNATVGGTLSVTGATTLASGSVTGDFSVAGALSVATPTADTHASTKKYVDDAVAGLINSAPALLNTLDELAAALGDDENFATSVYNAISLKLDAAGGTMTGDLDMGANKVTTSTNPTTDNELARKGYVDTILGSATDAATSASNAATSETNAATSETNAATSASNAATSASNAASSESNASTSASNAATSATSASTSATQAATSATNAGTSESNAATSAINAATSETNAGTSESNAASSATNAANSATAASTSETNAATSETNASTYATNAGTSASAASASATAASTSETNAANSASSAATSATSAANDLATVQGIYDSFDDRYLGSKASAPAVDNDGNALLSGALYWNSTDTTMYVWGGSSWTAVGGTPETLQSIGASIADTAVDVFVYDTRKDSDGGAWRKRTQHTSWYNETLNTATRGSRKEFPAVAVIVAQSDGITIYDGDDPDLPMWMVFNRVSGWVGGNADYAVRSISAVNGIISFCSAHPTYTDYGGIAKVYFISDTAVYHGKFAGVGDKAHGFFKGALTTAAGYDRSSAVPVIVSAQTNDVAMTVLPNAPIDPATQLPIPTIAVATNGGVSVIKDDGTVVDIYYGSYTASRWVDFDSENALWCNFDNVISNGRFTNVYRTIPTTDQYSSGTPYNSTNGEDAKYTDDLTSSWQGDIKWSMGLPSKYDKNTFGYDDGFLILDENKPSPSDGMYSVITSTYNTGWMNGDIKLATLSDTDATNVTGTELVTNGTFDTDISGWSANSGASWDATGAARVEDIGGTDGSLGQAITTEVGKSYVVTLVITDRNTTANGSHRLRIGTYAGGYNIAQPYLNAYPLNTTYSYTFVASTTTTYLTYLHSYLDTYSVVDNISVRLAEEDRSVNGNGLQVFGTVTKSPVATGADLVAYSGFGASNYLQQPYNSDLDFGTGDFCVMGWAKGFDTSSVLFERLSSSEFGSRGTADPTGRLYIWHNSQCSFKLGGSGTVDTGYVLTDTWQHIALMRSNGNVRFYANGALIYSGTNSQSIGGTTPITILGTGVEYDNVPYGGSLALWRISATAPTAEQIAKIYEDEKVLFQEGAQATLYGSSDAVTALAYDDTTDLLHVGTSAGRSDFSGLRRVSNTTTGVTTAISASNEMIVEQ